MSIASTMRIFSLIVAVGVLAIAPSAQAGECKAVHGTLVETRSTTGCTAPATACYLGEVQGNHGMRGTTYFSSDSARAGPPTSPSFISYSGVFEYLLTGGTLTMRETGVVGRGAVTAYQEITGGTGDFAGATGSFFVSGFILPGGTTISTQVEGHLCLQ